MRADSNLNSWLNIDHCLSLNLENLLGLQLYTYCPTRTQVDVVGKGWRGPVKGLDAVHDAGLQHSDGRVPFDGAHPHSAWAAVYRLFQGPRLGRLRSVRAGQIRRRRVERLAMPAVSRGHVLPGERDDL